MNWLDMCYREEFVILNDSDEFYERTEPYLPLGVSVGQKMTLVCTRNDDKTAVGTVKDH